MDVRYRHALVAIFASTAVLVALGCGGGDDDGDGTTATQPAAAPTSAAAGAAPGVAAAPAAAKPTPTQRAATSDARPTPTFVASFAAVTPWYQSSSYGVGTASGRAVVRGELLRTLVGLYFDALNSYDLNLLLPLLEEGYRNDNEDAIRDQLDDLESAGATLAWTEDLAPGQTGPTTMVMFANVEGGASGTERWQIQFTELGRNSGNWVISGAGPEG